MTDAIDIPTRRARRERDTNEFEIEQPETVILPHDGPITRPENIVKSEGPLSADYMALLAFNEDPVAMILQQTGEDHSPKFQECWVNGRGIEFLTDEGKWRVNYPGSTPGYAPIGVPFTTKRKYAEQLVRARKDRVETFHEEAPVKNPINQVIRSTSSTAPLSIIEDRSPKAHEWLRRVMREG